MKKTLLLLSLSLLFMYQCKKENKDIVDNNNNNNNKNVRVYCEIPMNSNGKSDFTNIFEGSVSWSSGSESVFLAVPGDNPKLIQLTTEGIEGNPNSLYFETYVCEGEITAGNYDLWYLGNSMHREEEGEEEKGITPPNVTIKTNNETGVIESIDGSIAEQSGDLEDVGCFHIAKAKVSAVADGDDIILTLNTTMENQMSLAYLDLSGALSENGLTLEGSAITSSGYSLCYDYEEGSFVLKLDDNNKTITVTNILEGTPQYVVLLPNETDGVVLDCGYLGGHTFKKGIEAGKFYYRKISELQNEPLTLDVNVLPTLYAHNITLDFRTGHAGVSVGFMHDGGAETEYGVIYSTGEDMTGELTLEHYTAKIKCEEFESYINIPMKFNQEYKIRTYATNKIGTVYTDVEEIQYIEYVDMGGGFLISNLNLGANTIYEIGDTYRWGALTSGTGGSHYNVQYNSEYSIHGNEDYDIAAHLGLGRMLQKSEFEYLINEENCTWTVDNDPETNEIRGYTCTSNETHNSVYFCINAYWTSTIPAHTSTDAYYFDLFSERKISTQGRAFPSVIRHCKTNK